MDFEQHDPETQPDEDPREAGTEAMPADERVRASAREMGLHGAHPEQVGSYRILDVLGAGGMGVVYRAEQSHPKREVALKLIRPGLIGEKLLKRFELEAEILGRLHHPGIAQVYEAGIHEGSPYFAMELIEGKPLTRHARDKGMTVRQRLELFEQICDAVHHAHQKGVVHRDLKPENILVDAFGQPKILDFGVARATDGDVQATTIQTDLGQLVGTIAYMSPEQATGDPALIDTRSDVYALGVILYELLAERLPYDLSKKMVHEAVRIIRQDEPTRLSSVVRTMRGDLETIVGKALEKEKERRYQSASALSADIERYLRDAPIAARPPSATYQLRKFARRNKALVAGAAAVFLALLAGVIVSTTFAIGQARALERERAARDAAERTVNFYAGIFREVDASTIGADLAADMRQRFAASRTAAPEATIDEDAFAAALDRVNPTDVALGVIDRNLLQPAAQGIEDDFRNDPLIAASLSSALADAYQSLGMARESLPHLEAVHTRHLENLGPDDARAVDSGERLGEAYARLNRFDEAEPLLKRAAGFWSDDPARAAEARANLALILLRRGDVAEGEAAIRRAIAEFEAVGLGESIEAVQARFNLGRTLIVTGRIPESLEVLDELFEIVSRTLGEEHLETLKTLDARAVARAMSGQLDLAEEDFRRGLELKRRKYGDDHPETNVALTNLGKILRDLGKPEEALPVTREAAAGLARRRGPAHPDTLTARSNVASLLTILGRHDEAESEARAVLALADRALSERDVTRGLLLGTLAQALWRQGEFSEAEPMLLEAHAIFEENQGPTGNFAIRGRDALAEMYDAWDEADPDGGHDAKAAEWRAALPEAAGVSTAHEKRTARGDRP